MKINENEKVIKPVIDFNEIAYELRMQHPEAYDIYLANICDEVFIYKPLCRKSYKMLLLSDHDPLIKEELVCKECLLWPDNYDFDECDAGIPSKLAEIIIKNSYLDDLNQRQTLINNFRQEMHDIDNQVVCMIHEVFPEFRLEEIENWDMLKTAEYCSKAEWILANFRQAQYTQDPFTGRSLEELQAEQQQQQDIQTQQESYNTIEIDDTEEINNTEEIDDDSIERIKTGDFETIEERQKRFMKKSNKERLTPEKLAELQKKFPEMQFDSSAFEDPSIDEAAGAIDTTSPALRPGW